MPQEPEIKKFAKLGWREMVLKEVFDEEKLELLKMSEISILLREYNDIFSDFDPRPYSERAVSDDFLVQAKAMGKVKSSANQLELTFLVPEKERKLSQEPVIKKRLHEHFKKHFELLKKQDRDKKIRGFQLSSLGFALLLTAAYLRLEESRAPLSISNISIFVLTVVEPAGWFTMWTGLEHLFFSENREDFEFYSKMSKAKINFISY